MKQMDRGILSSFDLKKKPILIGYSIMVLVLVVMSCSMIYPILTTFFNGLKTNVEVNSFPPRFLPSEWHFDNFNKGWKFIDLPEFLRNTLYIFGGNLVITVGVLGLASFSLSRLNVPKRKAVYFFFMMTLFIPPTTYIIPNFVNLKDLGLMNSFAAFWLPAGANAFFLLLLKNFFDEIHYEIFEAARIDGASDWRSFAQIALPLSVPIFSTLAIFIFSSSWNDWFWPSLIMHNDSHYPLATAIYKYVINAKGLALNIRFAILTMVMLPPIVVFLIFQKYIMRGLHLGGVKG
ncbi:MULTISPECIES: carbohydrate ABC transporter permease [unclassified Paenibacillus]|uniref:carbohydrate ABC transporter permease n=1 Tax=unclassified Paenibacillus TaxID=185978 RepID=UPI00104FAE04|nr:MULTISPECIES: carbohydrate ABC transporter permease [unclassified Paenibacillus]NIK66764.1 multiple sugar transport system permease protein [Paenibacillus sp. BK720]TCN00744.1 carbohydrate ABC transporter membrane protein 2 (CUT1 family) [Paenibacillus sp. BK033]